MSPNAPMDEDYPEAQPVIWVPGEQARRLREAIGDELFEWLEEMEKHNER